MSNHVHLIVVPRHPQSLALTLKHTHGRYAAYFNARHVSSGHVWQGRYYFCPLDPPHFWAALRYTELNPVRAGLVHDATDYSWSSAAAHCRCGSPDPCLEMQSFTDAWTPAVWRQYLEQRACARGLAGAFRGMAASSSNLRSGFRSRPRSRAGPIAPPNSNVRLVICVPATSLTRRDAGLNPPSGKNGSFVLSFVLSG